MVADGGRIVVDPCPLLNRPLQHVGGIDIFHVEGRILAHKHRIESRQRLGAHITGLVPGGEFAGQIQRRHPGRDLALIQTDVTLQAAKDPVATRHGSPHHGDAGLFLGLEGIEGIEDEKNVHAPPEKGQAGRMPVNRPILERVRRFGILPGLPVHP